MNAGFLNIWKVYRRGQKRPAFAGEAPRGEAAFDADVKVGEIRIFADGNQPLTALIVEDCGLSGRRIVPISPFAAPASERELMLGERVFQLWNTTKASRRFTDRSWRVATLTDAEVAEVAAAIPAAHPGRLTAGEGPQARYEREFLISAGNFIPLAEPQAESSVGRWLFNGWSVAASLTLCLGAFYLMFGGAGQRLSAVWHDVAFRATEEPEYETIELVEPEASEGEYADLSSEQIQREIMPDNSIPQLPQPKRIARVVKSDIPAYNRGLAVATSALPQEGFTAPQQRAILMSVNAPVQQKADKPFTYAAGGAQTIARAGDVQCTVVECPWNTSHRLLNVRAASAQGLKIEIGFDPKAVGGYRLLSNAGEGSINAFYEIVPNGLAGIPNAAVSVTTRWYDAQGARQRAETVRTGNAADLQDLPQVPRKAADATGAVSPDDVPVKVDL